MLSETWTAVCGIAWCWRGQTAGTCFGVGQITPLKAGDCASYARKVKRLRDFGPIRASQEPAWTADSCLSESGRFSGSRLAVEAELTGFAQIHLDQITGIVVTLQ